MFPNGQPGIKRGSRVKIPHGPATVSAEMTGA